MLWASAPAGPAKNRGKGKTTGLGFYGFKSLCPGWSGEGSFLLPAVFAPNSQPGSNGLYSFIFGRPARLCYRAGLTFCYRAALTFCYRAGLTFCYRAALTFCYRAGLTFCYRAALTFG